MILIPADQVAHIWPRVLPWIEAAVAENQGDENALDVLIGIARNHYSLWVDEDFAAVVQVLNYPRQRVLTILYLGGNLAKILPFFEEAKAWCRANKVDVLRTYGRPGWARVTPLERVGVILQIGVK